MIRYFTQCHSLLTGEFRFLLKCPLSSVNNTGILCILQPHLHRFHLRAMKTRRNLPGQGMWQIHGTPAILMKASCIFYPGCPCLPRFLSCSGYLRNPCRSDNKNTDSHPLSSDAPGAEQAECFLRIIYFLCRSAAGCRSPHGWSQRSRSRTGCRGAAGGPGG